MRASSAVGALAQLSQVRCCDHNPKNKLMLKRCLAVHTKGVDLLDQTSTARRTSTFARKYETSASFTCVAVRCRCDGEAKFNRGPVEQNTAR